MEKLIYAIDVLSTLFDTLWLEGWLLPERPVVGLELRGPGLTGGRHPIDSYGKMASGDVAQQHGPGAVKVRFVERLTIERATLDLNQLHIAVIYADGEVFGLGNLAAPVGQSASLMSTRFTAMLDQAIPGTLLEVGSRARSRIVRRGLAPEGWDYVGLDVMAGPNVDVVGDAHEVSRLFPKNRFDAVMSFSVLEHLLMPWKFVVELNAVMKKGAIGLFTTHQCWPMHDAPWDFWRFSDRAWAGLLNPATGFEIIEASMGEPAFVVSQRAHQVTDFGRAQSGYLASNVLFRKVRDTSLKWNVALADIVETHYPEGNL